METNAGYAYASDAQTTASRQSEVQAEIDRLAQTSELLDKCLQDLEGKLNPVLAQRKEEGSGNKSVPEPLRVPLADLLHVRGNHLEILRDRVSSMISRLEL